MKAEPWPSLFLCLATVVFLNCGDPECVQVPEMKVTAVLPTTVS